MKNNNKVYASIIIPTLNRASSLQKTLDSLCKQRHSGSPYEILVVDNGSIDETSKQVKSLIASRKFQRLKYIYEPIPGLLAARHRGAREAKGEILIYIDDDVDLSPIWLKAICNCFKQNPSVVLVGGKSLPKYEVTPPVWLGVLWSHAPGGKICPYLSLIDLGDKRRKVNPRYVFGLNYAIRKSDLYKYGGFNPELFPPYLQKFQGDGETGLSDKLISAHLKAEYISEAVVFHRIPKSRLTKKYIYLRAYSQGVSDSYTHLRRGRSRDLFSVNLYTFVSDYLKKIFISEENKMFLSAVNREYIKGYTFHQKQAHSDSKLFDWVKKPDYFDYSLPE